MRECSSQFASSIWGIPALTAAQGGTPEIPPPIGLTQVHIALRLEMGKHPEAFTLNVPTADIADLSERLARTRQPDETPGPAWAYGTDVALMRELVEYWRHGFDWRPQEARLNAFPQY